MGTQVVKPTRGRVRRRVQRNRPDGPGAPGLASVMDSGLRAVHRGDVEAGRRVVRAVLLLEAGGRALAPAELLALARLQNAVEGYRDFV